MYPGEIIDKLYDLIKASLKRLDENRLNITERTLHKGPFMSGYSIVGHVTVGSYYNIIIEVPTKVVEEVAANKPFFPMTTVIQLTLVRQNEADILSGISLGHLKNVECADNPAELFDMLLENRLMAIIDGDIKNEKWSAL